MRFALRLFLRDVLLEQLVSHTMYNALEIIKAWKLRWGKPVVAMGRELVRALHQLGLQDIVIDNQRPSHFSAPFQLLHVLDDW